MERNPFNNKNFRRHTSKKTANQSKKTKRPKNFFLSEFHGYSRKSHIITTEPFIPRPRFSTRGFVTFHVLIVKKKYPVRDTLKNRHADLVRQEIFTTKRNLLYNEIWLLISTRYLL